jgi:hypothetical protein
VSNHLQSLPLRVRKAATNSKSSSNFLNSSTENANLSATEDLE